MQPETVYNGVFSLLMIVRGFLKPNLIIKELNIIEHPITNCTIK